MKHLLISLCLMASPMVLTAQSPNRFDVNKDNKVNISDVVAVINYMATGKDSFITRSYTVNGVQFQMVVVEGGTFLMGSEAYTDEKPIHGVKLNSFSIGQTEVTQELWQAVMGTNPSNWKGAKLPVENVSLNDCYNFIQKLNSLTGQKFRLPTEAEWEFAAQGGIYSKGYTYSGNDNVENVAWYTSNSGNKTHQVATKAPNELGIYDMSGNLDEWCEDYYVLDYYSSSELYNPTGPISGSGKVNRGGNWGGTANRCRVTYRYCNKFLSPDNFTGLRLAL